MPRRVSKEEINAVLYRLTGHHLTKGAPGELLQREQRRNQRLRHANDELEAALSRARFRAQQLADERDRWRREAESHAARLARAEAAGRAATAAVPAEHHDVES